MAGTEGGHHLRKMADGPALRVAEGRRKCAGWRAFWGHQWDLVGGLDPVGGGDTRL